MQCPLRQSQNRQKLAELAETKASLADGMVSWRIFRSLIGFWWKSWYQSSLPCEKIPINFLSSFVSYHRYSKYIHRWFIISAVPFLWWKKRSQYIEKKRRSDQLWPGTLFFMDVNLPPGRVFWTSATCPIFLWLGSYNFEMVNFWPNAPLNVLVLPALQFMAQTSSAMILECVRVSVALWICGFLHSFFLLCWPVVQLLVHTVISISI